MKITLRALLFIALLFSTLDLFALEVKDLVGDYELQGVMEMAGMLSLKTGGRYEAGFSYGAADWVEAGRWATEGDSVVLSDGRFKTKNPFHLSLFLPSGTHLAYKDGKLTATGPRGSVTFVDPNKTPSRRKETGEASEGRMLVRGRVVGLDAETLVVRMNDECVQFAVQRLSPEVLKAAKVGRKIDVEIPYSAIIGGGSCPE